MQAFGSVRSKLRSPGEGLTLATLAHVYTGRGLGLLAIGASDKATGRRGLGNMAKGKKGDVEISFHGDNPWGDAHPAIDVKVQRIDVPDEHEAHGQEAWETVQVAFWQEATRIAHEYGYSDVFAEGRSGGWLVPYVQEASEEAIAKHGWQVHPETRATLWDDSPGQGGKWGQPRYVDAEDAIERGTFLAFREKIEALLAEVPQCVLAEAARLAAEAASEAERETRELAAVLVGLRVWQGLGENVGGRNWPGALVGDVFGEERAAYLDEIATNGGTVTPLSMEEIDTLCEELNTGGKATRNA